MNLSDHALFKEKGYVNGKWIAAQSGQTYPVLNPFNLDQIAQVADFSDEDTRLAILGAESALAPWKSFTASKRSKILRSWYELQMKYVDDLATILTQEQGKPLKEAKGEIKYGAAFVEWFAEEAKRNYGDVIPGHQRDKRIVVIKQPVGVVGAITPWNFPHAMITRKVAPALAAGCTVVIKPAEDTPLSALALAELADRAGFPPGVFNVVPSNQPAKVGLELTTNPTVRKISFTGSTEIGKLIMKQASSSVKKVSLELGGNAPFIVFEDADIDLAVQGAISSKYRNAGQTCICANRIFVHRSIAQDFIQRLAYTTQELKVGHGMDEDVDIGPLINQEAFDKVNGLVSDAVEKGANIVTGGTAHMGLPGHFVMPTVLSGITMDMKISHSEIFGPIAPVYLFDTVEEVITMANNTPFGLAAYFFGRDYALIWKVAEALEYGMIGINTGAISTPLAPFGGVKESGIGREGSKYGMDEFQEIKYLCFGAVE